MSVDALSMAMRYVDDDRPLAEAAATFGVAEADLQHALVERSGQDVEAAVWAEPPKPGPEANEAPRKSASTLLVAIAEERYRFGVSDVGEAYAVPHGDPKVVLLLRGSRISLRFQLSREFYARTGKAAPQQALTDALLTIEGMAQAADAQRLYLRVARIGDKLWLDLGDDTGRAAQVAAVGWSIAERAPVLFKRTALTTPLPAPVPGGTLDDLWELLNVTEADRPLVAAWLVAVLLPDIPHPVLGLFGEQGTGKSTAGKVLTLTLDPSAVPGRKPPRDADSWVTAASGSWVVGLDNLSEIQPWLSDSLCRAVTGEGDVRRKLYTDGDLAVFAFRRAIIINGIDVGAMRGDLAERMLPVDLDLIPDDKRRDEEELWAEWGQRHPRILGAVLDLAAGVLRALPYVHLESRPRMADFARVLAAVDAVLGTEGLSRYRARAVDLAADGLSADPLVVQMIATLLADFEGTSAELLAAVAPHNPDWVSPRGWPRDARQCTAHLRRVAPSMRKVGWTVTDLGADNHKKVRRWQISPPRPENSPADTRLPPHPRDEGG